MRRHTSVALILALFVVGCGDDGNSGSSNIFTFNNTNRQDMGGDTMDMGISDAGDAGADASSDGGAPDDSGIESDMPAFVDMDDPDMPMPPDGVEIMSLSPQTVVIPTSQASFDIQVTLTAPVAQNVRISAPDLPSGVTTNGTNIPFGQTTTTISFTMSDPPPFRGFINVEAVALDQIGQPVGDVSVRRINVKFTAPAELDLTTTVPNQILGPPAGNNEFGLAFDQPITNPTAITMPVYSDIRGLVAGAYDGAMSPNIRFIPTRGFLPDETLEVVAHGLETDESDPLVRAYSLLMKGETTGSAAFNPPVAFNAPVVEQGPMVRLDFNGDGNVDVAVFDSSEAGSATSQLCLNDMNGNAVFTCDEIFSGTGVTAAVAGDFNADGRIDLVVASKSPTAVEQLCINTDGTLAGLQCADVDLYTNGYANRLVVMDSNQDGLLDLVGTPRSENVVTANGERVRTCINDGGAPPSFTCTDSSGTTRLLEPEDAFQYDFNGDGSLEFVRSSRNPVRTEVCRLVMPLTYDCTVIATMDTVIQGDISFVDPAMVVSPYLLFHNATGVEKFEISVSMTGAVTALETTVPGLSGGYEWIELMDIDGDRDEDAFAVQADGGSFACISDGMASPTLSCTQVVPAFAAATSANGIAADFDGDGKLDFIVNTNTGGSFLSRQ